MDQQLSPSALMVLGVAGVEAASSNCREITPDHVYLALLKLCDFDESDLNELARSLNTSGESVRDDVESMTNVLLSARFDVVTMRRKLREIIEKQSELMGKFEGHRSPACRELCRRAHSRADTLGDSAIRPIYLLWAIVHVAPPLVLRAMGEDSAAWNSLRRIFNAPDATVPLIESNASPVREDAPLEHRHAEEVRPTSTPFLDRYGRDLTALARKNMLSRCIGRKDEMRQVAQILRRATKNTPVLVGEPGVGKTCVVEGLAQRIVQPNAPKEISSMRIVEVATADLIAGCSFQGQFEERVQNLVAEAKSDDYLVLFFDEIHTIIGMGGASDKGMDAAQILKPALARGEIRLIGATTVSEYRKYIEGDAAFERRFQAVWINEPNRNEAVEILEGLRDRLEKHHGVVFDEDVIEKSVEWAMRYLPDHRLPDKVIDIIDHAAAATVLKSLTPQDFNDDDTVDIHERSRQRLTAEDVAKVLSSRTQIPLGAIASDENAKLLNLEHALARRVQGQDRAIQTVASVIRNARAGLKRPNRPAGVCLFLGPTGTGKTELAKTLAEELFGSESSLIRVDMSEYGEKHNVSRLIGAPPGYIGHDEEGELVGKVRSRPFSVVLFDEVEKAHPDVYDIFLQIFDDGHLTDAKGRKTHFNECTIMLTSNIGSQARNTGDRRVAGFRAADQQDRGVQVPDLDGYEQQFLEAARDVFRPEILNRIQHVVVFRPLTSDVVAGILDKIVAQYNRLLTDKGVSIQLNDDIRAVILDEGYSKVYGARELERVFDRRVVTPLSQFLLENSLLHCALISIGIVNGEVTFET